MTQIYSHKEIKALRSAGNILTDVHLYAEEYIKPLTKLTGVGISFEDLDFEIGKQIISFDAIPILKGYSNPNNSELKFPCNSCISSGSTLVHGIPIRTIPAGRNVEPILFTVDIALKYNGWVADAARTYTNQDVISDPIQVRLLMALGESIDELVNEIHAGWTLMDIGVFIKDCADKFGFTVPLEYGGHGIGRELHMQPHIPCLWRDEWPNTTLEAGMVVCIEPMFIAGDNKLKIGEDGWSVITKDGSVCAHKEVMVLIESRSCEVLAS